MSDRGTCWSVTINNPTKSDDEWIAQAQQKKGWKVYGQREKGEQGTEHYQLMVTTPQVRFTAVKKAFPRAHIELARDRTALLKYVQKEDTRVADIPSNAQYPTYSKIMEWFGEECESYGTPRGGIDDNEYIKVFDIMIRNKIREGYYCESYALNPQVRGAVLKFGRAISFRERQRRQTDRQTAENIVPDIHITNEASSQDQTEHEDS